MKKILMTPGSESDNFVKEKFLNRSHFEQEINANFDRPVPKYVLCPGYVVSRMDGKRHFISAKMLAKLYQIPMSECEIMPDMDDPRNKLWHPPKDAIELCPKSDGDYRLPILSGNTGQ